MRRVVAFDDRWLETEETADRAQPPALSRKTRVIVISLQIMFFLVLGLLLLTPLGMLPGTAMLLWVLLLLYTVLMFSGAGTARMPKKVSMIPESWQPEAIKEVMSVQVALERGGVKIFKGRLRGSADSAYQLLKDTFATRFVPLIQDDEETETAIILVPEPEVNQGVRGGTHAWINWALFFATFVTTTWAGALHRGVLPRNLSEILAGLPFSAGLMAILGVHELGHYFLARRHAMDVTPPYFIPVPFGLGTFGAFIKMRSAPENRLALFDVAIAGPLAGLVIAIPALVLGLRTSAVVPAPLLQGLHLATPVDSSLLFSIITNFVVGGPIPSGYALQLSPLAFAGWLGLLVTALNLFPVGQLDGGHIAHAMFGARAGDIIGRVTMWALFLLALLVWPGLMLWAIIVFLIAGRCAVPMNDLTPITPGRRVLGVIAFIIFALIILPAPNPDAGPARDTSAPHSSTEGPPATEFL